MFPPSNTGSFGAPAGGISPALQQVITQHQQGQYIPTTSQITNGSPMSPTAPQPASDPTKKSPIPSGNTLPNTAIQGQTDNAAPMPFESPEAKMIVGALTNRLKTLTEMQKNVSQPQPVPTGI